MLRAVTLSDAEVKRAIGENWVATRHNQCPGLYCSSSGAPPIEYPREQMDTVQTGAGGGNIRFYFCDPDGVVVLRVTGFVDAEQFLEEEEVARMILRRPDLASSLRRFWPNGPVFPWHEIRRKDRACAALGRPVQDVLREVEDDVYLKGGIG